MNKLKYLIYVFLVLFSLTPLIWFWGKKDVLINGVDTNFPLDPLVWFMRRFYAWSDVANAGSDFSSSVAGLFFHSIQTIPYVLGFNLHRVEFISLVFWFALIVFSAFIFARTIFPNKPLIHILFVAFYAFNIYLFNTWENVKVANLSLVAAIPLGLAIFQKLSDGSIEYKSAFFYCVLTGIILSGAGLNPAYFLVFFLALVIYFLGSITRYINRRFFLKQSFNLLLISFIIFLVNLFWILPTANFISKNITPGGSLNEIGFRNWVYSISENTSLLNVLRLQGAWDWYAIDPGTQLPYYIPYSLNYFNNTLFLLFSFLIPLLAVITLIVRNEGRNYLYLIFGVMLVLGTFLGAGTHAPSGSVYSWLADHLPFFSFFRSPWYIFTPLVTLSLAGLLGLLMLSIEEKLAILKIRQYNLSRVFSTLVIIILISGNLIYSYPLILGKIFRPGRSDGFFIKFPEYVFDAKDGFSFKDNGRIINYPPDENENFKWGYRGIESILALLFDQELIFAPFNNSKSPIAKLINEFYQGVSKNQTEAIRKIAAKLNASVIFYKDDQKSLSPSLPKQITSENHQQFGSWYFYPLINDYFIPKIFTTSTLMFVTPYHLAGQTVGALANKDLILNIDDDVIKQIPEILHNGGRVVLTENSQIKSMEEVNDQEFFSTQRIFSRNMSTVDFTFEITKEGNYIPLLERYKIEDFGINLAQGLEVRIDDQKKTLLAEKIDDSYIEFDPVSLPAGNHKISINIFPKLLLDVEDFSGTSKFERIGEGKSNSKFEIIDSGDKSRGNFLSILNLGNIETSAVFNVEDFDPYSDYYFEIKHKQVHGNVGRLTLIQLREGLQAKVQSESLPNYPEWRTYHGFYAPNRTDSSLTIKLEAPRIGDPLGTKVLYDDLRIHRVFTNRLILVNNNNTNLSAPGIEFKKVSPVLYEGTIKEVDKAHLIVFSENFNPQWQLTTYDMVGNRLSTKPKHFSANLYANAWFVDQTPKEYKFKIYYQPQNLLLTGFIISGLLTAISAIIFGVSIGNKLKKKHD